MLHSTELNTSVRALAVFTQHSFVDKRETLNKKIKKPYCTYKYTLRVLKKVIQSQF